MRSWLLLKVVESSIVLKIEASEVVEAIWRVMDRKRG